MSSEQANRILAAVEALPSFAKISDRAMADLKSKDIDGSYVDELGFHDPKLARQILQMTSFTAYSFGGHRAGASESSAVGDDLLRGVMLAFPVQWFTSAPLDGYGLAEGELWEHLVNCGISCWMMATKVGYGDLEKAFVAGLLHDIGKVVLDKFLYEEKEKLVDTTREEGLTPVEAEHAAFGIDHAEVGAALAEKWGFASPVVEAVRYHHRPELAQEELDLAVLVHLADVMCMSFGMAFSNDGLIGLLAGDRSQLMGSGS